MESLYAFAFMNLWYKSSWHEVPGELEITSGVSHRAKKRRSTVAALPGWKMRCSNFPGRKEGKKKTETEKEGGNGRERKQGWKERRGKKQGEKGKGIEWGGILGKKKYLKRNEGECLATMEKIFFEPCFTSPV